MNILIVGDTEERAAVWLAARASARGWSTLKLDEQRLGADWSIGFDDARAGTGHLKLGGIGFDLSEVAGCFVRLARVPPEPSGSWHAGGNPGAVIAQRRRALECWLDHLPLPVANRPGAVRCAGYRSDRLRWLMGAGLPVPARTLGSEIDAPAPASGRDVRIHAAGRSTLATVLEPAAGEWVGTKAPRDLIDRCCALAAVHRLLLAGFDFRVTPRGRWYCLDLDPSPDFVPFEATTGEAIADALLDDFAAARGKAEPRHRATAAA